jgi:hypothetical protein
VTIGRGGVELGQLGEDVELAAGAKGEVAARGEDAAADVDVASGENIDIAGCRQRAAGADDGPLDGIVTVTAVERGERALVDEGAGEDGDVAGAGRIGAVLGDQLLELLLLGDVVGTDRQILVDEIL